MKRKSKQIDKREFAMRQVAMENSLRLPEYRAPGLMQGGGHTRGAAQVVADAETILKFLKGSSS